MSGLHVMSCCHTKMSWDVMTSRCDITWNHLSGQSGSTNGTLFKTPKNRVFQDGNLDLCRRTWARGHQVQSPHQVLWSLVKRFCCERSLSERDTHTHWWNRFYTLDLWRGRENNQGLHNICWVNFAYFIAFRFEKLCKIINIPHF